MQWHVYITYLVINILSIPLHLSFMFGAFMGVIEL